MMSAPYRPRRPGGEQLVLLDQAGQVRPVGRAAASPSPYPAILDHRGVLHGGLALRATGQNPQGSWSVSRRASEEVSLACGVGLHPFRLSNPSVRVMVGILRPAASGTMFGCKLRNDRPEALAGEETWSATKTVPAGTTKTMFASACRPPRRAGDIPRYRRLRGRRSPRPPVGPAPRTPRG